MKFFVLCVLFGVAVAQRPYYAGSRPVGYGYRDPFTTEDPDSASTQATVAGGDLSNRVGDETGATGTTGSTTTTTTQRLPIDAMGDRELINRISKWPADKQPYWYLNWQQIEAQRLRPVVPQMPVEQRPFFHRLPTGGRQGANAMNNQNTQNIQNNQNADNGRNNNNF